MSVLALAVLLTVGNDISMTIPSEETLKGAWRVGNKWRDDPPSFMTDGIKTAAPRRQLETEGVVVEWRSPLREAYKKGHEWTLEESKFDFAAFLREAKEYTHRLCFDITVRALPDGGYASPSEAKVEGLRETSCSLLIGGRRFDPLSEPKFPSTWKAGKYSEGGLVFYQQVGKDLKGIYVEPKSEFRSYENRFNYAEAKTRVEFDPTSAFDTSLDELIKTEFAIEVEVNGQRHRIKFTPKGREDFLKRVAQQMPKPAG